MRARHLGLGSAIRRNGYWALDRLRGSPIRTEYEEVGEVLSGGSPQPEVLDALLLHASSTTDFYRPYAGHRLDGFPVINKSILQENQEDFLSGAYPGDGYHRAKTSGSTGDPIVVHQDRGKRVRTIAETLVFNEMAGQRLGDRLMWFFAARLVPMSRRKQFINNIVPMNHLGLDGAACERVVDVLQHDHINAILGINSTYQVLARFFESHDIDPATFGVKVVIAVGENMVREEQDRISAAFGCSVVNRYAAEEFGMFATTTPDDERLLLNRASYRFEFLKLDADERQAPGELARVVVTDLYNRATPFIRYDTGDLAIVGEVDASGEATSLSSVEGRRRDVIYNTSGGQLASTSASAIVVKPFPQIRRFQLVQEDRTTYQLRVVQGEVVYGEEDIARELRRWLGSDASIEVESVPDIPTQAGGKHRPVIGRYKPRTDDASPRR